MENPAFHPASASVASGWASLFAGRAQFERLFRDLLDRLSLDRVIPRQVRCSDGLLTVGPHWLNLASYRRVLVAAIGKAAYRMTAVTADIVAPIPLTGVITGPSSAAVRREGFQCFQGGHPYPNEDSFRSAKAIIEMLRGAGEGDLVLFLLSGGGSAICEKPLFDDIALDDFREFYSRLVTCGAGILEVNFIRKHFSALKGGRAAELAAPADILTLYVSDAPPDAPSNVASGPTMPDESSVEQCLDILARTGLSGTLPESIERRLRRGELPETPKPGAEVFRNARKYCLLSPEDAVAELAELCRAEGWVVETDLSVDDDCPRPEAATRLLRHLDRLRARTGDRPAAVVTGGEYSCPVDGDGVGGRNQAFALECVPLIAGRDIAVLSAGTDGIDGISPAAGAYADGTTLRRAKEMGLDPAAFARRSDSHGFFSRLGDAIVTGPTGNNVRDVRILTAW